MRPQRLKRPSAITSMADAIAIAHTLSEPSKMPWYGYSLPASTCKIGAKLAKQEGTVCSSCYALKGRYLFANVQKAMMLRYFAINDPLWVDAMVFQLQHKSKGQPRHFRWHDSGDIQSVKHLRDICEIAARTPHVQHWLPTREVGIVREFLRLHTAFPPNLTVRLSAHKVGQDYETKLGLPISTVGLDEGPHVQCEAYKRAGKCGDCRACWTPSNINYPLH